MTYIQCVQWLNQFYPHFGWLGSLIIFLGCLAAAVVYRGKNGEKYSLLNHFISELGEMSVSKAGLFFNLSLFVGGILLVPFITGVGKAFNSVFGYIGMVFGLIAAVSAALVGVYSMDTLNAHRRAAMTFFRSGLMTLLLFTVAVFLQPGDQRVFPLGLNLISILAISAYVIFLVIISHKYDKNHNENYILDPNEMPVRPRFWRTPFMEWMLFLLTIAWFVTVSFVLIF